MATRTELMATYRAKITAPGAPAWTSDTARVDRFMEAVANTLNNTPGQKWQATGALWWETLREHGITKNISMKALRALEA